MKNIAIYPLILTLLFVGLPASSQAAKILSIFPHPGPSQYIYGSALLKGLAEKGHQITSVSVFPQKKPLKNFRDVPILESANMFDDFVDTSMGEQRSFFQEMIELAGIAEVIIGNVFENKEFKALLKNEQFDLIILEVAVSEALLGLGEHFKAPVIAVSTFGTASFIDYLVGNPSPLSYIPHMGLHVGNDMCLWQRLQNVFYSAFDNLIWKFVLLPIQERLYRTNFPSAKLSLDEARKNVSLVLLNNHFSLSFPRPYVSNMIEAGGLQIKENPDPLPKTMQDLLDQAKEGAIYFSLGSNVKSKNLPPEIIENILEAFRELKIPVLWKFEADELPNKPDNVFIQKWFPQPSVLAHPNVKLFISHGGFLSTTETIHFGKPILGIPVFADQFINVNNAVNDGYALRLDLKNITKDNLMSSIDELWNNPKYTQTIQKKSKQFRDQPMTPMETAIYWVEYVLRHEGAVHMRNPGQHLNFWQYHNIDVYVVIFIILAVLLTITCKLLKICKTLYRKISKVQNKSRKIKAKSN